jgi:NADH-quinone oxidoreductase subunit M
MNAIDPMILTLILLTPLAGAIVVSLAPDRGNLTKWLALAVTLLNLLFTLHLPAHFAPGQPGFQFEANLPWIEAPAIAYHVGVDGISLWLVVLTGLLAPVGVVASWNAIRKQRKSFYALFLLQQTTIIGVFIALDLVLYFSFWELSLLPMTVLIALFGRKEGAKAALKFFLFAFIPSAPLLAAILWLYAATHTFDYVTLQLLLAHSTYPGCALFWCALAFFLAFAVKVPIFPLHGWLADAYAEAPVAIAMIVAGKLGLYSMLRFHVGLFPEQARLAAPWIFGLAIIGVLYGGCMALAQRDFWRLLAFATLSHLSLIVMGVYGQTAMGMSGAVYQTLSHGVMDGAFFLLLGGLYERYRTSRIDEYGGLAKRLPQTATLFVITSLALLGLPMLNGFVGEFMILTGTFVGVNRTWTVLAALGVILGAAYMLWLVQRICFGVESEMTANESVTDLRTGESAVLWALAVLMLAMGLAPSAWLAAIQPATQPPQLSSASTAQEVRR